MTKSKGLITIDDVKLLTKSRCEIKDTERVEKMINELINGGLNKLQVVSDFDFTITKQRLPNGEKPLTSFGIFNKCKSIPADYIENSDRLFDVYHPIEIDPFMSVEEKTDKMVEWWKKSSELFKGFSLDQKEIDDVAHHCKEWLRDGTPELIETLEKHNVPLLVFSAGLGDCVKAGLKQAGVYKKNVSIVSNFLKRTESGELDGFTGPLIHTFNKNETALEGTPHFDLVHSRDHIILMGDSIGDADMAKGVPRSSHVLKIAFLNDHIEENLAKYQKHFDIVLIEDQTMNFIRALLSLIEENS